MNSSVTLELAGRFTDSNVPTSPLPIVLSDDEDTSEDTSDIFHAEGQSFIIDYVASNGQFSRRRITVWKVISDPRRVLSLYARCHERGAMRQFRVDRIKCCYDYDGVEYADVKNFLRELFGISEAQYVNGLDEESSLKFKVVSAELTLLAAMAGADTVRRKIESETAVQYLANLTERRGNFLSEKDVIWLSRSFNMARPTANAIERAIGKISKSNVDEIKRIIIGIANVMDSDGERHPEEVRLLNSIAYDMIGTAIL